MVITGVVSSIIYHNNNNNFYILSIDAGDREVTLKGTFNQIDLELCYEFHVVAKNHPIYGEQYEVEAYKLVMPTNSEKIVQFLASGIFEGIGQVTAERIVQKFGEDTLDIMRFNPERLKEVNGIGRATLAKIVTSFATHLEAEEALFFLNGLGLSAKMSFAIYEKYGQQTIAQVRSNPYNLISDVRGLGFNRVDQLADKLGFDQSGSHRTEAYIQYYLNMQAMRGHMYVMQADLLSDVTYKIKAESDIVLNALENLHIKGEIIVETTVDAARVYSRVMYDTEIGIVREIARLQSGQIDKISFSNNFSDLDLTEEQQVVVDRGLDHVLFILTGGPGTGKTTILKEWVLRLEMSELSYSLCAPTGRAASRMEEVIGRPASTIHRLLEYKYQEDTQFLFFNKNSENPLLSDVVIVDEVSMIDAQLFLNLLLAIKTGSRVLLIGDINQLPAVGPGNVLGDLINSQVVDKAELKRIHRQAADSLILNNAHAMLNGKEIVVNQKERDFFFIKATSNRLILDELLLLVSQRLPKFYDIDPIDSITVLTPLKAGMLGAEGLNKTLQEVLNPAGETLLGRFRTGDKVMQNRNNYNIKWHRASAFDEGEGIFNGEIGRVEQMTDKGMMVHFSDGKRAVYSVDLLDDLVLAYAMTIHKSQGNEFDYVVIPMYQIPDIIKSNNLIYTAVTRAKKQLTLIGEYGRFNDLIHAKNKIKRHSSLAERLSDVFEKVN